MYIDTDLAHEVVQTLSIRESPVHEKTGEEQARSVKTPPQRGDTVTISKEARALAAAEEPGRDEQLGEDNLEYMDQHDLDPYFDEEGDGFAASADADFPEPDEAVGQTYGDHVPRRARGFGKFSRYL